MTARAGRVRVAAYAVATHADMLLLTKLHDDDPSAGMWTLPGGGLDFGEQPEDALHREVYEETGLRGPIAGFLGADSREFPPHALHGHRRLHSVRLLYRMSLVGEPAVVETGGSTVAVAWVPLAEIPAFDTVDLVQVGLRACGVQPG